MKFSTQFPRLQASGLLLSSDRLALCVRSAACGTARVFAAGSGAVIQPKHFH